MNEKYQTGVRFNHPFRILETLSFVGEGVGAALFILSVLTRQLAIAALGVAFVVVAVLALRAHLGQPTRGWRAVSRLSTSWVSRGTLVIGGFLASAALSVIAAYAGIDGPLFTILAFAALGFAIPVVLYAGLLLRSIRAIRFWGGAALPIAFPIHSAATSLTIAIALMPWLPDPTHRSQWLIAAAVICLLLSFAASTAHIMRLESSAGTRASLKRLIAGDLRFQFVWGAGIFGVALPVIGLIGLGLFTSGDDVARPAWLFAAIALSRLYGDFAYRHAIVLAGAYEPIMPQKSNRIAVAVGR